MTQLSVRSHQPQGATFIELFFDLVFVFAVTQTTAALVHDLTWGGALRATVVFWLVWWAWTQWTWSLNEADTEHRQVRGVTLVATAVSFVMALSVPELVEAGTWIFPVSYIVVRLLGIAIQLWLAEDAVELATTRRWAVMSSLGLFAVAAVVFLPSELRFAALGIAAVLDVIAAVRAGTGEWRLFPGHFCERHGLFVIIALGESLIAAGMAVADQPLTGPVIASVGLTVVAACALWWAYFVWVQPTLEHQMRQTAHLGRFARDVFSFSHFPLIGGIIGFAAGAEEAVAHPTEVLSTPAAVALAAGLALFVLSTSTAARIAGSSVPAVRPLAGVAALALVPLLTTLSGVAAMAVVATAALVVAFLEPKAVTSHSG